MGKKQEFSSILKKLEAKDLANKSNIKPLCEGVIPKPEVFSTIGYMGEAAEIMFEVYNNLRTLFGEDILILKTEGLNDIDFILRVEIPKFFKFKNTLDLLVQEHTKQGTTIKEHITIPNVGNVVYVRPPWSWDKENIIETKVTLAGADSFIADVSKDIFEGVVKLLTLTDYGVIWSLNKKVLEDYIDKVKSEQ